MPRRRRGLWERVLAHHERAGGARRHWLQRALRARLRADPAALAPSRSLPTRAIRTLTVLAPRHGPTSLPRHHPTPPTAPPPPRPSGRHYEICYLISPDNSQEALQEVIVKYKSMIEEQGGTIHRLEDWGRRPLAYAIKGKLDANYVLMNFEVDPEALTEFNTELNKDEKVIRFMTFSRKEAISEPSPMLGGLA